jgi:D-alanyl-D-alanine carboxypeptidase
MKSINLLFLMIMACSCAQQIITPVQSCVLEMTPTNDHHPKAEKLQALLDEYVQKGLPGISMVVYTPEEGQWMGVSGVSRIEDATPMQTCNVFHSASVAKTYHAVAAMTLVEAGKLELDKTIDHYLPDWVCTDLPNRTTATVRQLMNHTSGINDFIGNTDHMLDYFNNLMRTFTTAQYLDYVCGKSPDFEPGAKINYSNTNTVLLALIMDEIAGNHADVISEHIIQKLNLQATFYKNEQGYPAPAGAVNTYVDTKGNGQLINSTSIERNFAQMSIGHDAMMASAYDYYLFIRALFEGALISQASLDEMLEFVPYNASIDMGEGLGLSVVKTPLLGLTRAGHDGGSLGAANNVHYYPEKGAAIVICSNFGGFVDGPLYELMYSPLIGNKRKLIGQVERLLFDETN